MNQHFIQTEERQIVQLFISTDGRYTNPLGFNSEECTVLVADALTSKLLFIEHVLR